jgi:hypothetical protein
LNDSTQALVILILILLVLLVMSFFGSTFLMKRAMRQVVKIFRDGNALTAATARTEAELGFKRRGLLEFKGLRDYKPSALQFLVRNNIVQVTEDARLFLSEENLTRIKL